MIPFPIMNPIPIDGIDFTMPTIYLIYIIFSMLIWLAIWNQFESMNKKLDELVKILKEGLEIE